ncbi:MAG: SMI1/KNR4 family protein [Lachnospiraceae bacterium]|nr:SMI1/KNR4 family protein [Lachnospiraceae bacterium]
MDFLSTLEKKWGKMRKEGHYTANGKMSFISDETRLNVVFEPIDDSAIESAFYEKLKSEILPELKAFYKKHNGCRLFFSSLSVFGVQQNNREVYEPYDIVYENLNYYSSLREKKKPNIVFFASLGGKYLFGYDRIELSKVYCIKKGSKEIEQEFDSFDEFFSHYFDALIKMYDADCHKVNPNEEYKGIPVLENVTYDLIR